MEKQATVSLMRLFLSIELRTFAVIFSTYAHATKVPPSHNHATLPMQYGGLPVHRPSSVQVRLLSPPRSSKPSLQLYTAADL